MYLIACIVHVLCMYFDVSRSIKIHQDSTSRYIKIHLYLALQSSEHLYLTNSEVKSEYVSESRAMEGKFGGCGAAAPRNFF